MTILFDNCVVCQTPIRNLRRRHGAMFCQAECSREHARRQFQILNPSTSVKLSTVTTGAAHELFVAADLMFRGYAVFRALSGSCECDLAILTSDRRLLRVEVTTGYYTQTGKIVSPKNEQDGLKFDVLAIVVKTDRKIIYQPTLESLDLQAT